MKYNKNNIGNWNTGEYNAGDCNSGDYNTGDCNSGDVNSGGNNTGYHNSGNWNSGDRNLGYRNSGEGNSGTFNSGDWNSGNCNSGCGNSGDWNSGYGNSCNHSSGVFCTKTPRLYFFNKPTDKNWDEIEHPNFKEFYLNKWISELDMTEEEKINQKDFHVRRGYLKTYTWEEAWANYWRDCDAAEKEKVLNLPNFDADIFKEITGINVNKKTPLA